MSNSGQKRFGTCFYAYSNVYESVGELAEQNLFPLDHAFFGPGTTAEPFCRLEKLGGRPIFTCLQT